MTKKTYPALIDWYVPPGKMLEEYLQDKERTNNELSQYLGVSEHFVEKLITSEEKMTYEIAQKVSSFLGMKERYWIDTIEGYEKFLSEKKDKETISNWIKQFPYSQIANLGYLKKIQSIQDKLNELSKSIGIEMDSKDSKIG